MRQTWMMLQRGETQKSLFLTCMFNPAAQKIVKQYRKWWCQRPPPSFLLKYNYFSLLHMCEICCCDYFMNPVTPEICFWGHNDRWPAIIISSSSSRSWSFTFGRLEEIDIAEVQEIKQHCKRCTLNISWTMMCDGQTF